MDHRAHPILLEEFGPLFAKGDAVTLEHGDQRYAGKQPQGNADQCEQDRFEVQKKG